MSDNTIYLFHPDPEVFDDAYEILEVPPLPSIATILYQRGRRTARRIGSDTCDPGESDDETQRMAVLPEGCEGCEP